MKLTTQSKKSMKLSGKAVLGSAVLLVILLSGCSKNSDPSPVDLKASLSAKTWLVKSLNAIVDAKSYPSNTELAADEINFKPGGVYTDYDPTNKSTSTGTWSLNGKTLTISDSTSSFYGEVSDLNATGFTLSLPEVDFDKLDLTRDYSNITPADKDYINIYQLTILVFGDFQGYDPTKKNPDTVQIVFKFGAK